MTTVLMSYEMTTAAESPVFHLLSSFPVRVLDFNNDVTFGRGQEGARCLQIVKRFVDESVRIRALILFMFRAHSHANTSTDTGAQIRCPGLENALVSCSSNRPYTKFLISFDS